MSNTFNIDGKIYEAFPPRCPYCNIELEKFPGRKTKCKSCNEYYYSCREPKGNVYHIVTETTKVKWKEERELYELIISLKNLGVTNSFVEKAINRPNVTLKDSVWTILNEALAVNGSNFNIQPMIYRMQAKFVKNEGTNPYQYLQLAADAELINLELSTIEIDAVIIAHKSDKCSNCWHLNGKVYNPTEARRLKSIPVKNCEYNYCYASYAGRPKRDFDGFVLPSERSVEAVANKKHPTLITRLFKLFK